MKVQIERMAIASVLSLAIFGGNSFASDAAPHLGLPRCGRGRGMGRFKQRFCYLQAGQGTVADRHQDQGRNESGGS